MMIQQGMGMRIGFGRILLCLALALSLGANVMLVASQGFHEAIYSALGRIPLIANFLENSVMQKTRDLEKRMVLQRAVTARIAKGVALRTARNATRHVAGAAGEAVPYAGAALVVAITVMDIKDACDSLRELNELKNAFDLEVETDEAKICGLKVPSIKDFVSRK